MKKRWHVTSLRRYTVSLTVAASSCQDEPVLQLVQGRTPKDEQNLGYLGWIMMDPNISKPIGPLDHWLYQYFGGMTGISIHLSAVGEVTRVPGFWPCNWKILNESTVFRPFERYVPRFPTKVTEKSGGSSSQWLPAQLLQGRMHWSCNLRTRIRSSCHFACKLVFDAVKWDKFDYFDLTWLDFSYLDLTWFDCLLTNDCQWSSQSIPLGLGFRSRCDRCAAPRQIPLNLRAKAYCQAVKDGWRWTIH